MSRERVLKSALSWAKSPSVQRDENAYLINALVREVEGAQRRHKNLRKIIRQQGKALRRRVKLIFGALKRIGVLESELNTFRQEKHTEIKYRSYPQRLAAQDKETVEQEVSFYDSAANGELEDI